MFPCHTSSWSSTQHPVPCGPSQPPPPAQQTQTQPLPDLLCSCPAPALAAVLPACSPANPDPMESLIVITEYEPSLPDPHSGDEEVRQV